MKRETRHKLGKWLGAKGQRETIGCKELLRESEVHQGNAEQETEVRAALSGQLE